LKHPVGYRFSLKRGAVPKQRTLITLCTIISSNTNTTSYIQQVHVGSQVYTKTIQQTAYNDYLESMTCFSQTTVQTYWLPPESDDKISLSVTVLLSFFVLLFVVTDIVPPSSNHIAIIGNLSALVTSSRTYL